MLLTHLLTYLAEALLGLAVQPAERPRPDDNLQLRDLARISTIVEGAALPHPRPEPSSVGPWDGAPEREAAEHAREEEEKGHVRHGCQEGLEAWDLQEVHHDLQAAAKLQRHL